MVGGTLYTTTFPCHNCTRHIVASGIAKVYYIEPYAKSLALELHNDAIELRGKRRESYFSPGPRSTLKLFPHNVEHKNNGKAIVNDKRNARPALCPPMFGFTNMKNRLYIP